MALKAIVGGVCWIVVAGVATLTARSLPEDQGARLRRTQTEFFAQWLEPRISVSVLLPTACQVEVGNGVFVVDHTRLDRIGEVVAMWREDGQLLARVEFDPCRLREPLREGTRITWRTQGKSLVHCVKALLPADRMEKVEAEWREFLGRYETRLAAAVRKLAPRVLRDVSRFLADELPRALEARNRELERMLEHYRREITEERLVPLLANEIWPIVARHAAPVAEDIGRELWDRAPLFELAWRAAWDRLLSDGPVKLEARWRAFLAEEAIPTLRAHEGEIRATLRAILSDVASSEQVRGQFRSVARELVDDPQLHELATGLLADLVVDNPRLMEFLQERARDPSLPSTRAGPGRRSPALLRRCPRTNRLQRRPQAGEPGNGPRHPQHRSGPGRRVPVPRAGQW